jgi:hypothetical protein
LETALNLIRFQEQFKIFRLAELIFFLNQI